VVASRLWTLSGNPVAVAAGSTTLRILKETSPYQQLEKMGARLAAGLVAAAIQAGVEHQVQRVGSMMTLFFQPHPVRNWSDADQCNRELFARYFWGLIQQGIYMPCSQFEALFFGITHTEAMIDETIDAAATVMQSF
jgi:glutamate-1-semialdehyde 2,1-aminomutase